MYEYELTQTTEGTSGVVRIQIQPSDIIGNLTDIEVYSGTKSNSFFVVFDRTAPSVDNPLTNPNIQMVKAPDLTGPTAMGWYNQTQII